MCGAFAIRLPSPSKIAHEKSSRSLMFTEYAVFCSRSPICSAIDMNRLLKISSRTGSASVPSERRVGSGVVRVSTRLPCAVICARQPGRRRSCRSAPRRSPGRRSRRRPAACRARRAPRRAIGRRNGSAPRNERAARQRRRCPRGAARAGDLHRRVGAADRLDRRGFGDERRAGHQERVALPVGGLERVLHLGDAAGRHVERRIGALVAQVHAPLGRDPLRRHALFEQRADGLVGQPVERGIQRRQ